MNGHHLLVFITGLNEDEGVKWFVTGHSHVPESWLGTQLSVTQGRRKRKGLGINSPESEYCHLLTLDP